MTQELQAAMEEPPTEEEFRWALHDQKKSTTPGMSNVTYGNIKDWPDELITHGYQLLRVMWRQEHIPQAWKENGRYYWPKLRTRRISTTYAQLD